MPAAAMIDDLKREKTCPAARPHEKRRAGARARLPAGIQAIDMRLWKQIEQAIRMLDAAQQPVR